MRKFLSILCTITVLSFLVVSCSKETQPESSDNILTSFSLPRSLNTFLDEEIQAVLIGSDIMLTVPNGTTDKQFTPKFNNGPASVLVINGKKIQSEKDKTILTDNSTIISQAPNGEERTYKLLLREGNVALDTKVYNLMKKYSVPGVTLTISKNEVVTYEGAYGYADKENNVRTLPTHLFRLASMSKSQTSICIMKLIEEGKISITDKVFGQGGILQDEFTGTLVSGADAVTVQNLLEHNSGWESSPDPMFTADSRFYGKSLDQRIDYVVHNIPLSTAPGTKYSYYNLGYGILGKIIEKVSGREYEEYLKSEIHAPLGIKNIHIGGDRAHRRADEVVYYSQDGTNGYGNDMQVIKAAGGIIASGPELMRLMSGVDYNTIIPDILKPQTLDLMYSPSRPYSRYAKGWRVNYPSASSWASYHSGNLAGTGVLWIRGKNNINGVILCNSRSYLDGFDDALYIIMMDVI